MGQNKNLSLHWIKHNALSHTGKQRKCTRIFQQNLAIHICSTRFLKMIYLRTIASMASLDNYPVQRQGTKLVNSPEINHDNRYPGSFIFIKIQQQAKATRRHPNPTNWKDGESALVMDSVKLY